MKPRRDHPLLTAMTCLGLALPPSILSAQEEPDPANLEEAMKKYANPGKEHRAFRAMAGTCKAESSYWVAPGSEPMTSIGESRVRLLMKGRYLSEQFSAESEQFGSFQGLGTIAYDRLAKEYIHTWIDTMGTGIMISRGQPSGDGNTIEVKTTYKDPVTMQDIKYRIVFTGLSGPKREMEMFATYPDKDEFRAMQIVYTRIAGPAGKAGSEPSQNEGEQLKSDAVTPAKGTDQPDEASDRVEEAASDRSEPVKK